MLLKETCTSNPNAGPDFSMLAWLQRADLPNSQLREEIPVISKIVALRSGETSSQGWRVSSILPLLPSLITKWSQARSRTRRFNQFSMPTLKIPLLISWSLSLPPGHISSVSWLAGIIISNLVGHICQAADPTDHFRDKNWYPISPSIN
jgi:hypothetical protein